MNKHLLNGIGLVALALMISSCGPKASVDIHKSMWDAQQMATEGKVDEALAGLESLFNSSSYKESQPMILATLLQIEVTADRLEAAEKRFIKEAAKSPEVVAQSSGIIENALMSKEKFEELVKWCESLRAYNLGDAALAGTANRHLAALTSLGRTGEVDQVIASYLPLLSESAAIALVQGYFSLAVNDRQWDQAQNLLGIMDKLVKESPSKQVAKVGLTLNLLLAKDGWKAADSYLRGVLQSLPDAAAAFNLRIVGAAEVAANELAAADSLYEFALVDDPSRPGQREAAAVGWVNVQVKRGGAGELIQRLTTLQTKKIPVEAIVNLISQNYLTLLGAEAKGSLDALNQLCESLRVGGQGQACLTQLDGVLLDISFFREDFEGSLKIIERGLIIEDPIKKAMMINKVNAHMALKKGDYKGAISWFRKFMDTIAKDQSYTVDLIDQVRISREMILGLNARRIGDLWIKDGNAEEAKKAYLEAQQYYTVALKEFADPVSDENKKIVREMSAIPKD